MGFIENVYIPLLCFVNNPLTKCILYVSIQDPAYQTEATVLYMNTSVHPLFPWQHSVIVERLMQCGAVTEALRYLQCHGRSMQGPEELKLKLGVYVGNSLITEAYRTLVRATVQCSLGLICILLLSVGMVYKTFSYAAHT